MFELAPTGGSRKWLQGAVHAPRNGPWAHHCVANLFLLLWAVSKVYGGWVFLRRVLWFVALAGQRVHNFYDYIMPLHGLRFGPTNA